MNLRTSGRGGLTSGDSTGILLPVTRPVRTARAAPFPVDLEWVEQDVARYNAAVPGIEHEFDRAFRYEAVLLTIARADLTLAEVRALAEAALGGAR